MPTVIQFVGGESLTVSEDFETVFEQLKQHDQGLLNGRDSDGVLMRVNVYRGNVAFIQEAPEGKGAPLVGFG